MFKVPLSSSVSNIKLALVQSRGKLMMQWSFLFHLFYPSCLSFEFWLCGFSFWKMKKKILSLVSWRLWAIGMPCLMKCWVNEMRVYNTSEAFGHTEIWKGILHPCQADIMFWTIEEVHFIYQKLWSFCLYFFTQSGGVFGNNKTVLSSKEVCFTWRIFVRSHYLIFICGWEIFLRLVWSGCH